jgi:hypothetical protein
MLMIYLVLHVDADSRQSDCPLDNDILETSQLNQFVCSGFVRLLVDGSINSYYDFMQQYKAAP